MNVDESPELEIIRFVRKQKQGVLRAFQKNVELSNDAIIFATSYNEEVHPHDTEDHEILSKTMKILNRYSMEIHGAILNE